MQIWIEYIIVNLIFYNKIVKIIIYLYNIINIIINLFI